MKTITTAALIIATLYHFLAFMSIYFSIKYWLPTFVQCWWECKLVQPLWKTVWKSLKKLKIELPYDPAIPLQGVYPKKKIKH